MKQLYTLPTRLYFVKKAEFNNARTHKPKDTVTFASQNTQPIFVDNKFGIHLSGGT